MSLKTISIGAIARAMAATSVLGATLVPAVAAAQTLTPAEQADALAQAIATAVENALQNSTGTDAEDNVKAAIEAAIDGADPAIAKAALAKASTLVLNALPTLTLASSVKSAVETTLSSAFTAENSAVQAAITNGTGSINNGKGNNGKGNGGNGNGGGAPGGGNGGGNGGGGGGGGGGSHRPG